MARLPGTLFARNLVERRGLIFQLVRRDFGQRFVGSAAGWLWAVIHPLVLLLSYTFVFSICLKMPPPAGEGNHSYSLYLFAGLLPWWLFTDTVQRSSSSMLEHANLITKTVFPSEIVPVSIFLSSLINHLIALVLALVIVGIYVKHFSLWMFSLPAYMILIGLLAIGIGWIVASLHVYLRDTAQVLVVVLTFWFWITPIFINEKQVPAQFRWLLRINPLSYLVRAYRNRLLSTARPSLHEFAIIAAYAVTAFVLGGLFFRHLKRGFADVL